MEQLETLRANLTKGCLLALDHHAAGTLDHAEAKKTVPARVGLGISFGLLLEVEAAMGLTVEI